MADGHRRYLAAGVAGLTGCAALLAGCTSRNPEPVRLLRTEDFLADTAASRAVARSPVLTEHGEPASERSANVAEMTPVEASEGVEDVEAFIGAPVVSTEAGVAIERPILIDAKIGEINGRPVRVDEILGRLDRRLTQRAREEGMTRNRWLQEVHELVHLQLEGLLQDELLRAEALASLRPEQRMGLRYMVQEMSENMRRQARGSRAEAERRLREQGGTGSLAQMEREQEAQLLVDYQVHEKIRRRIRVSWKDVRLYYERNFEVFNPPATAHLRVIRVPADRSEAVATIQQALADGKPFAEVASLPENAFNSRGGGLQEQPVSFKGELATAELDLVEPMATVVRSLKPGKFNAEPVEFMTMRGTVDKMWVYLDSVRMRNRPLSDRDVQREIADFLTQQQMQKEVQRHIARLMERASFTDLDEMTRRLVQIAAERYWPQG